MAKWLPALLAGDEGSDHGVTGEKSPGGDDGHGHESDKSPKSDAPRERGEAEHEGEGLRLTPAQTQLAGIGSVAATRGPVDVMLRATGEVSANQDRVVEVVPLVSGVVREARALLGSRVQEGDVMAILDSRELADAKSAWVTARERTKLAAATFERTERLWKKRIVPEQDYLDTRGALAEARIQQRAAEHKLRALGLTAEELPARADGAVQSFTRFELTAPMSGTVIAKNVTTGESVDSSKPVYRIADLSDVWIIASIYEKDFSRMALGQRAKVESRAYPGRTFDGKVTWVSETVDERTRTLKVRIQVDNPNRLLRPGMFINAEIAVERRPDALTVPAEAVRRMAGETVVFVDRGEGRYEPRTVAAGKSFGDRVEILRGVAPGERVVSSGSFILKSEIEKGGFEAGHGH